MSIQSPAADPAVIRAQREKTLHAKVSSRHCNALLNNTIVFEPGRGRRIEGANGYRYQVQSVEESLRSLPAVGLRFLLSFEKYGRCI